MQEVFDAENIARSEVAIAGVLVTEVLAMSLFVYRAAFHLGYQVFYAGFLLLVNTTYVTGVTYCAVQINLKQQEQRSVLINESFLLEAVIFDLPVFTFAVALRDLWRSGCSLVCRLSGEELNVFIRYMIIDHQVSLKGVLSWRRL